MGGDNISTWWFREGHEYEVYFEHETEKFSVYIDDYNIEPDDTRYQLVIDVAKLRMQIAVASPTVG